MEAIDKVHGDGPMKSCPVKKSQGVRRHGEYSHYGSLPEHIKVSHHSDSPDIDSVHELGHYLDHQGLGGGHFASEAAGLAHPTSALRKWYEATKASKTMQQIKDIYLTGKVGELGTIPEEGGHRSVYKTYADRNFARYLQKNCEVFARSYAQYITIRSGDPVLLEQLNLQLNINSGGVGYPEFWPHDDFQPIAKAFDELFAEMGWRK